MTLSILYQVIICIYLQFKQSTISTTERQAIDIFQNMEQQRKTRLRKSEQFIAGVERLGNFGKRTGTYFQKRNQNLRSDGFARWSDYIAQNSEDYSNTGYDDSNSGDIPRVSSNDFSLSRQTLESKKTTPQLSQQPQKYQIDSKQTERPPSEQVNTKNENSSEERQYPKQQCQMKKKSIVSSKEEKNDKKYASKEIVNSVSHQQSNYEPPFVVPELSSIKHRQIKGRNSEQFLLDLLKSERSKRQQYEKIGKDEQQVNKLKNKQKEESKQKLQMFQKNNKQAIKSSKFMDIQTKPRQKTNQIKESKPEQRSQRIAHIKSQKQQIIYKNRQYHSNQDEQEKPKSKRVTINDRGKIKLPTDSFSRDFDRILPPQLTNYDQDNLEDEIVAPKRKREQVIYENEEQQQDLSFLQPMDIVVHPKEDDQHQSKQNKGKKQKSKGRGKKGDKNEKKSKTSSISNNQSKPKTTKSQKKKQKTNHQIQKLKPTTKLPFKDVSSTESLPLVQNRRKKVIKDDQNQIVTKNAEPLSSQNSRPCRIRSKPLPYWLNQKAIYNCEGERMNQSLDPKKFLEIIGFDNVHRIQANLHNYRRHSLTYIIKISPNQRLYSTGINIQKMKSQATIQDFNQIYLEGELSSKDLSITVDNTQYKGKNNDEEKINIEEAGTVQIKNKSNMKTFSIYITLERDSKKK